MKKLYLLLLAAALLLIACGAEPADVPVVTLPSTPTQTVGIPTTAPTTSATALPPAPVFVSPLAVEDLLLPVAEYSWERKAAPEYVMLHFTSAIIPHPEDPYRMDYIRNIFVEYDLSVHYIVERDGTVHCYVPEDRVAWHAGVGIWGEDPKYTNDMNQYAIGIEIVAIGSQSDMSAYLTEKQYQALDDSLKGFTEEQYASLKLLVADICSRNAIALDRSHVIGHSEYNSKKTDPGELFDWSRVVP